MAGLAAATSLAPSAVLAKGRRKTVGIVGGGIIGASLAYQLARSGADVILFEKDHPAAGATSKSVAWINASADDLDYIRLRQDSMRAWREDDRALGMGAIWGGSLNWINGEAKAAKLRQRGELLARAGSAPTYLSAADIGRISSNLRPGEDMSIAFELPHDGHVDPVFATGRFLAAARRHGARILYPCAITGLRTAGGTLTGVTTSAGEQSVDELILVAGTATPHLLAMAGLKLELSHAPGLTLLTRPRPVVTKMVYEGSGIVEFKQYADGRLLTSYTPGPPDLPVHAGIRRMETEYPSEALRHRHAAMLIAETARYMPIFATADPLDLMLGFRPKPLDNRPIAGPVPGVRNLHVVVTHSGVTLAPLIGRVVAREVMTGIPSPVLAPYRPDRFITI